LNKKNAIFIINLHSGVGKQLGIKNTIKENIDNSLFNYRIVESEYRGHITDICREVISEKADIIIVVGGDGTINEAARVLAGTDIVLGIIPAGSGNGLASHLQLL